MTFFNSFLISCYPPFGYISFLLTLYLNNNIFIAKFSETAKFIYKLAKFIYKLAKFVFSEYIVVFYKVFCHNIFPLD